ncbi:hypothetical protein, partial [Methylobacterium sp. WL103]|uniref:hypothetical protein n=1 Tax=Methylobacterium sp. WL103 TaxID=2603891 RepID=UPI001AEE6479
AQEPPDESATQTDRHAGIPPCGASLGAWRSRLSGARDPPRGGGVAAARSKARNNVAMIGFLGGFGWKLV